MNVLALITAFFAAKQLAVLPVLQDQAVIPQTSFSQVLPSSNVLGFATDQESSDSTHFATLTNTPTASASPISLIKKTVRIALLGDSMVDTLGPTFVEFQKEINMYYPEITPEIYNYGVGATNIDYGVERITADYDYLGRHIPALVKTNPDILVLESFGYNPYPYDEGAINQHWLALAHAVDAVKKNLPGTKIVIAATIAPNAKVFADGAPGLNFSALEKEKHVKIIKEYLESTTKFAAGEHLPLADAYHPSLLPDGNGNLDYINGSDHIHPSNKGREFFAKVLMQTIVEEKLLE